MAHPQRNFSGFEELEEHIKNTGPGAMQIEYRNCPDYEGMVLSIMLVFGVRKVQYALDLQWASFGLDFWGDTLMETYQYSFESLEELLAYLHDKYGIAVTDIPLKYQYDGSLFPSPLKEEWKKPAYEKAWERFLQDFKSGAFLDPSLIVV